MNIQISGNHRGGGGPRGGGPLFLRPPWTSGTCRLPKGRYHSYQQGRATRPIQYRAPARVDNPNQQGHRHQGCKDPAFTGPTLSVVFVRRLFLESGRPSPRDDYSTARKPAEKIKTPMQATRCDPKCSPGTAPHDLRNSPTKPDVPRQADICASVKNRNTSA